MKQILKAFIILPFSFSVFNCLQAQPLKPLKAFTHADTLRGTYGPTRTWWNLLHYDLNAFFNLKDSSIAGSNIIHFEAFKKSAIMQIDLQEPMIIDKIQFASLGSNKIEVIKPEDIKKDGNAYFFPLKDCNIGNGNFVTVSFHGKPRIAIRPPWDGGLIMKKDEKGNPFVSIACQGLGASVWYPCKDHQADEPDSGAAMHITIPDTLMCVGNGRFGGKINNGNGTSTYTWSVK
ncbi:MAG: M1 family peptidase, partial [Ferruginibacter sp.]